MSKIFLEIRIKYYDNTQNFCIDITKTQNSSRLLLCYLSIETQICIQCTRHGVSDFDCILN